MTNFQTRLKAITQKHERAIKTFLKEHGFAALKDVPLNQRPQKELGLTPVAKAEENLHGRRMLLSLFQFVRTAGFRGTVVSYDEAAVSALMRKPEIRVKVALGLGRGRDRVLTCDLTKDYVAVNADYRS